MIAQSGKQVLNAVHGALIFGRRVEVLADSLARAIPPGPARVLDLGCGDGQVAVALMRRRPELVVEGVDVLVRPVTHIPVTPYDGAVLPFTDKSFDHVTIVDVLHHTDDPAAVLTEAARVAKTSVVIKDHLREGFLAGPTLRLMDWVGNRGHDVRLPYNYLDENQWHEAYRRRAGGSGAAGKAWALSGAAELGIRAAAALRFAARSGRSALTGFH